MKVYFWEIASSATFTWLFFDEVDYVLIRGPYSGVIMAKSPRRKLELESMIKEKASMIE